MVQNNYQKGKTFFGVIAVIAIIALLCLLFIYICKSTHATRKAKEIAESVAIRTELYCPDIPINYTKTKSKKYAQNGPHGTTIVLQSEQETPQPEQGKLYFSVVVDGPSKAICKKLIKTDIFKADLITIDGDINGKCPGVIRFYFTCPYNLDSEEMVDTIPPSYDEADPTPHFTFAHHKPNHHTQGKLKCKEPLPYEDKNGNCVECITSSQCHESQDCVENMCQDCPEHSNRTVRIGQRIGTRNCYCQEGYQVNIDLNGCTYENNDWDVRQNCVGNHCSVCPENANHKKGQRVGSTDCYCEDGYLPRQTGESQWQCAKVAILYPETTNQIIVHDEKYPVEQTRRAQRTVDTIKTQPQQQPTYQQNKRPMVTEPRPLRQQNYNSNYSSKFENFDTLFEPIFIQNPTLLPFPTDANWDIRAWESLEITIQ